MDREQEEALTYPYEVYDGVDKKGDPCVHFMEDGKYVATVYRTTKKDFALIDMLFNCAMSVTYEDPNYKMEQYPPKA